MPHSYILRASSAMEPDPEGDQTNETAPADSAPVLLTIYTDDDGIIQRMAAPRYRAGDAAMKQLLIDWHAYVDSVGSPPGEAAQDVTLFWVFLEETYGTTYTVGQRY